MPIPQARSAQNQFLASKTPSHQAGVKTKKSLIFNIIRLDNALLIKDESHKLINDITKEQSDSVEIESIFFTEEVGINKTKVILLPKELQDNLISFLNKGCNSAQYVSYDFIAVAYNKDLSRTQKVGFVENFYIAQPPQRLEPGQIVAFQNDDFICQHYAIYLSEGVYLSKFNEGKLAITSEYEINRIYSTTNKVLLKVVTPEIKVLMQEQGWSASAVNPAFFIEPAPSSEHKMSSLKKMEEKLDKTNMESTIKLHGVSAPSPLKNISNSINPLSTYVLNAAEDKQRYPDAPLHEHISAVLSQTIVEEGVKKSASIVGAKLGAILGVPIGGAVGSVIGGTVGAKIFHDAAAVPAKEAGIVVNKAVHAAFQPRKSTPGSSQDYPSVTPTVKEVSPVTGVSKRDRQRTVAEIEKELINRELAIAKQKCEEAEKRLLEPQ